MYIHTYIYFICIYVRACIYLYICVCIWKSALDWVRQITPQQARFGEELGAPNARTKPEACMCGLRSMKYWLPLMNYGLLSGVVGCYLGLLSFPGW